MTNQNKKSTWALCLSIIAIVLCLFVFALWIFDVYPRSVVTAESFMGACVALLGVIVTVAVGWQIYNAIEMRQMIRQIEGEQASLDESQSKLDEKQMELSLKLDEVDKHSLHLHHLHLAAQRESEQKYVEAVYYYLGALYTNLELPKQPNNGEVIIAGIRRCLSKIPGVIGIPDEMYDDIYAIDAGIKSTPQYSWFKTEYNSLFQEFSSKIVRK